jgi:putative transcriptional regulator
MGGASQWAAMESLRGKLLLSAPNLFDPNFRRTVVLIAEHTEDGALGLVLNRPAGMTVADAVPELAWIVDSADDPVYAGGPVGADSVIVLAEFDDPSVAAAIVMDDLGFVPANEVGNDRLAATTRRARVFAGHAGWGPGQLEEELAEESWIVEPARAEDVFTTEPGGLWGTVLRRKGREWRLVSTMPVDPSLN